MVEVDYIRDIAQIFMICSEINNHLFVISNFVHELLLKGSVACVNF